ncbi:MAG: type II secretion system protein [Patescibacteria group bacterium]
MSKIDTDYMTAYNKTKQKGFTLIELLVVIGILAVLLSITLIAINPARQFAQANNTQRRSDVNSLLNAINQYMADNNGDLPTGIDGIVRDVSSSGANICAALVPEYIAALPVDPSATDSAPIEEADCTSYDTNYQVIQTSNSRITVSAPDAELSETITVTR